MSIQTPKIVVFDNSTLGRAAKGYFSDKEDQRHIARDFVQNLTGRGYYIGLSTSLLLEFFGHADNDVFRCRRRFLRDLPCVAWIRPYSREWFVGDFTDVLCRELHTFMHEGVQDVRGLTCEVREHLWETGVGCDMFSDSSAHIWEVLRTGGVAHRNRASYVASMVKSDPTSIGSVRLVDLESLPLRDRNSWQSFTKRLIPERSRLIKAHGDIKISADSQAAAADFYSEVLELAMSIDSSNLLACLSATYRIPLSAISDRTTVSDFGSLVSVSLHLQSVGARLNPPVQVSLLDVGVQDLPTLAFERALQEEQSKALRYTGNDMADSRIAAIGLYADAVEVDKRTFEYIGRLSRRNPLFRSVGGKFIRSTGALDRLLDALFEQDEERRL